MTTEEKNQISSQENLQIDRYLWIARAFSCMAVLSFVANVLLLVALGALYPLVRVQPFYLRILDKNQQVVQIDPIKADELRSERVEESMVRQIVEARYTVGSDRKELEERWGKEGIVFLMSTSSVFDEFYRNMVEPVQADIEEDNLQINAKIINAQRKGADDRRSVWIVTVLLTKMTQSSSVPTEECRVDEVNVRYDPLYKDVGSYGVRWKDRLKNPLGFRVIGYGSKKQTDLRVCKQKVEI